MFRKVYQKRVKATIVYATETGRSRNYANIVKDLFGRVFATKVLPHTQAIYTIVSLNSSPKLHISQLKYDHYHGVLYDGY